MAEVTAHQFPDVFKQLGIDLGNLGCIMLDTGPLKVSDLIKPEDLYKSDKHKYIDGVVSETVPHVTLLYGLMRSGPELQLHIDQVLEGWELKAVTVAGVSYFESREADESYYCIIAKLKVTPELLDGNARLKFLPHIDGFPTYQPHITLAYIKHDETVRDELIYALNERFAGKLVNVQGINYGD